MKKSQIIKFAIPCSIVAILVTPFVLLFFWNKPIDPEDHIMVVTLWCVLPFIWGLWSVFIPKSWLPYKYPLWGAILGLILGIIVIFFLDLLGRVFQLSLSIPFQIAAVLFIVAMYYLFWMVVRWLYLKII